MSESEQSYRTPPRRGMGRHGGMPVEKAKDSCAALRSLVLYCRPQLPAILIALLLCAAGTVFNVIGPRKIARITNLIQEGLRGEIPLAAIQSVFFSLAFLYGLGWLFGFLQHFILATVSQRVAKRLRTDISRKINRLPLRFFDTSSLGDVLSRVTNDVDLIGQQMHMSLGNLISSGIQFTGSLLMMLLISPLLTLCAIAAALLGFFLLSQIMSRSQKYFVAQQKDLGSLNGHIEESFSGHAVVKAYHREDDAARTFDERNERLFHDAVLAHFLSGLMMPLMGFVGNLGYVVVCIAGAFLLSAGKIDFGVITAFMIYIRLFTQPLSQVAQVAQGLQSAVAAGERVFELLGETEMPDESGKTEQLPNPRGDVSFERVRFGYSPEKTVIHNFSAEVRAGQKIVIVGPTGAGKTTMVNLLMRFYEADGGEIRIDGVPITELTRDRVHGLFGMVLQDTWLFEGTLRENLAYSVPNVTDAKLDEVCRSVGLSRYVETLPNGYDTMLNEDSAVSAGQRQLITIARAMLKDAPLLILDEATSSIDTRTERTVQQAMDTLMQGRTSFIIAHRLSTIRNADLILVMRDGDIAESGTHDELMEKNGFYAALYNSQFEDCA